MLSPLDTIRARIEWGEKHVKEFETRLDRIMARKKPPGVGVFSQVYEKSKVAVVVLERVDPLPTELSLLVSDAVHSFRSALDQLIFELAFIDSRGVESEKAGFPGSLDIDNFRGGHVQHVLLKGLTKTHKAMLKRFQPYRGWNGDGPHPIALLHDLSNDDKHRLIHPTFLSPQDTTIEIASLTDCHIAPSGTLEATNIVGRPLEKNTELLRIPVVITGPQPKVEMKGKLSVFVGFRNGRPVDESLWTIARYVRDIVDFFSSEFVRPVATKMQLLPRQSRLPSAPISLATHEAYATVVPYTESDQSHRHGDAR